MIKLFSEWVSLLDEAKLKSKKIASISHTDIDRWLKSVDGLAKDLKDLENAKKKAQNKMSQIGKKNKPEEIKKPVEKDIKKPEKEINQKEPVSKKPIENPTIKKVNQKPESIEKVKSEKEPIIKKVNQKPKNKLTRIVKKNNETGNSNKRNPKIVKDEDLE